MTYSPARVLVDLAAVRSNVERLRAAAPTTQVMAVVKADAYGHGLVPVARSALQAGATWLGVAQLAEALSLRTSFPDIPVLTWLYGPGAPLAEAIEADIDLSVAAPWALQEVRAAARGTARTARIHLKVDTGMGRGGLLLPAWLELLDQAMAAQAAGEVSVVGVWSHLACADMPGHPSVPRQLEAFADAVHRAEVAGAHLQVRHLANSAGTLLVPGSHYDLVRPGIAVYGLTPAPQVQSSAEFGLVPAMRLEADLVLVKDAPAGMGISYAHTYTTSTDTRLAIVPLGYADGIPRHASNTGPVQVGGTRSTIAGRVCMDQIILDLGPDHDAQDGDTVVLFGSGADGEPTAQEWADVVGTINYEIVTRIGNRIPRTYLNG